MFIENIEIKNEIEVVVSDKAEMKD